MSRRTIAALGAMALGASLLSVPTLAGASPGEGAGTADAAVAPVPVSETGSYVVIMEGDPLVVTEGGGDQVATRRGKARGQQMRAEQARVARDAGVEPTNTYTNALNGFSAVMDHDQAESIANRKDVRLVVPDYWREAQTDASGEFLGLEGRRGAWDLGYDGEGVVVGVIDTGIWPEHPSFADDGSYPEPPVSIDDVDVDGTVIPGCDFGKTAHNPADADFECNDKLIGARQMLLTYRAVIGAEPNEYDSARDDDGHGTHTASTAAGNAGVEATVGPHDLGEVSGIAPRAHVVAYKGLGALGGFSSDLAAAVDQAVADGVDVINYSIGGGPSLTGADDLAFLFAADAGVHVATSAGNSGPGDATIGGPASVPWLTTVGASTQPRFFAGTVELGNGASYQGASLTDTVGESPLVDAADATADQDDLCVPGTLDEEVVAGAIVLCRRGAIARVDKSLAVQQAGGVGMIMYENSDAGDRFTDTHHVPSVHVDQTPGLAIKDYIATTDAPTAAIVDTGEKITFDAAPSMTSFSSRGPDPVAEDLIKPDVTAPGMQILAGASPTADPNGNLFQSIAGTSMSSPHVAGLMALVDDVHPDWSPAMVKSALMTTAYQDVTDNDRVTPANPFQMGAGHVDPSTPTKPGSLFDPGLVYDAGINEYIGFLCDAEPAAVNPQACTSLAQLGVPTTATDLNVASIGASAVPGNLTVTRSVTSVASHTVRYKAQVDAPDGVDVTVTPSSFRIAPGETVDYQVTFTNASAPVDEWVHGSLTWKGGAYRVYSPISVKPVAFDAPYEVIGDGVEGSVSFDIDFGWTGEYTAAGHGLEPATIWEDEVAQDEDQTFQPSDVGNGAVAHEVTTTGAALLRVAVPPDGVVSPDIDIDVFVHDSAGTLVAESTNGGTDELIDLVLPEDDTYTVYIHGWQTLQEPGSGSTTPVTTYAWVVSATPGGSLDVTGPSSATIGEVGTVEASWTGATAGEWHLGAVSHSDADGLLGLTLVEVDNR